MSPSTCISSICFNNDFKNLPSGYHIECIGVVSQRVEPWSNKRLHGTLEWGWGGRRELTGGCALGPVPYECLCGWLCNRPVAPKTKVCRGSGACLGVLNSVDTECVFTHCTQASYSLTLCVPAAETKAAHCTAAPGEGEAGVGVGW